MARVLSLALVAPLLLAAGCADRPADGAVEPAPAPEAPVQDWQAFTGSFMASTPVDCEVAFRDSGSGLFNIVLDVDERSKGQRFTAYINATDAIHVLFTRVEFQFEGADPTRWTFEGSSGQAIEGAVPDADGPVRAWFDVCGATGEVTVTYSAPLSGDPPEA